METYKEDFIGEERGPTLFKHFTGIALWEVIYVCICMCVYVCMCIYVFVCFIGVMVLCLHKRFHMSRFMRAIMFAYSTSR